MDKYFSFIDGYNFNNKNNNRFLIVGPSGSMKTSLAISLILSNAMGRKKRIVFINGGQNKILDNLKGDFEKNGIKIEVHIPDTKKQLIETIEKIKMNQNELLVIDDMTHFLKDGSNFLIKIFTTSRQAGYDVILILHKYKLLNPILRQNCNNLFFTKIEKDMLVDYPNLKKYKDEVPISIIDDNIYKVVFGDLSFDEIKVNKNLPTITKKENTDSRLITIGRGKTEMNITRKDDDLIKDTPKKRIDLKNIVRKGILVALNKK